MPVLTRGLTSYLLSCSVRRHFLYASRWHLNEDVTALLHWGFLIQSWSKKSVYIQSRCQMPSSKLFHTFPPSSQFHSCSLSVTACWELIIQNHFFSSCAQRAQGFTFQKMYGLVTSSSRGFVFVHIQKTAHLWRLL